jgi:hypothetical protein
MFIAVLCFLSILFTYTLMTFWIPVWPMRLLDLLLTSALTVAVVINGRLVANQMYGGIR